jgi:eukaryotic-like serine/threonine-protein kinase
MKTGSDIIRETSSDERRIGLRRDSSSHDCTPAMPDEPDLKSIFMAAVELPPEQRTAYLDEATASNSDLRRHVEALLRAHDNPDSFLSQPAFEFAPAVDVPSGEPLAEGAGTVIGPYKLLQQIGEGGMGVVFMAEQTHPVQRIVALKIIKPGMDSRQVIARLEAERQALALMDHPNIAKVLDAGTTETGRPYFVMELVKGIPITRYCDDNHLTPNQRLELFIPVCQAVQHAHQKGIIHRDLKPSNVLVALYDCRPVPKVIDFGVAKATGQKLTERTMFTQFGQIVGTLEYMSPEQAELNQVDIDTRSDIYSLGVLLYELLTGTTPFESKRLREAAFDEILRIIREEDPPKPSARLSTTEGLPSIAANRQTEPRKLTGLVRGELDWIVMKALEKDRARRYDTANNLAADVASYLSDQPVLAARPSATYRIRKYIRRHRFQVAAVTTIFVTLVAGIAATMIGLIRATNAERIVREQKEVVTTERDRAAAALNLVSVEEQKARAALSDKTTALAEKSAALKRERITAYANTLMLARREWLDGNLARTAELLDGCHADLRHWEWFYLRRMCGPTSLFTVPCADTLAFNRLPITSDGKTLLLYYTPTDEDGTLAVMNASTGAVTPVLGSLPQPIGRWTVSGDGQLILSGSEKKSADRSHTSSLELRNVASGESLFKVELPNFSLESTAVNQDGTVWAATGTVWQPGERSTRDWELRVWKRESPDAPLRFPDQAHVVDGIAFSRDGSRLLISCSTGYHLLETADFKQVTAHFIPNAQFPGAGACFSCDGRQFAYAASDVLDLCDTATGNRIRTYHLNNPSAHALAFGAGDRTLAYGTARGNVVALDLESGKEEVLLRLPHAIKRLDLSPDGSRLVTLEDDGQLRIWDTEVSPESDLIPGHAQREAFTAAVHPAGRLVAAVSDHHSVLVWDIATKELKQELATSSDHIFDIAFSPTGTELATAAGSDGVQVWNLETGARIHRFVEADHNPIGFADRVEFSRRGNWLVGSRAHGATIWDLATGTEVHSFPSKGGNWFASARLTADNSRLATCGQSGELQLWDTSTGSELFNVETDDSLLTLCFSCDEGQIVACGCDDGKILVVDARTGEELRKLSGHAVRANTVAFSSDGKRLVSAGQDGAVKIWEAETGLELLSLQATCHSALFSPDSRRLITTEIGGLRIWDAGVSPIEAQERVPR